MSYIQSHKIILLFFLFQISITSIQAQNKKPYDLRVGENFNNPMGFYNPSPSFSWKLPADSNIKLQTAYQIVTASSPELLAKSSDLWDTGKVVSSESTGISYQGKKLDSRQKVYWKVKFWDQNDKASKWSDIQHFELGLLRNEDWTGQWIGLDSFSPSDTTKTGYANQKIQYLRKEIKIPKNVASARLYVTSKGIFDFLINAQNISNDVMSPGWTPYQKRIETLTYDVTDFLKKGDNTLAVSLAPGWYAGRLGWEVGQTSNFRSTRLLCQLEVKFDDGSVATMTSDGSWKGTTDGPIRSSEIYDGELFDANYKIPGWSQNAFDDKKWQLVKTEPIGNNIQLQPKKHHTAKVKDTLRTIKVASPIPNSSIFDLGQNMVGVPLIKVPMKAGDTLKVKFAEMLNDDGTMYTENYRTALSTDYYVASKDGNIEWFPRFTFHGFRYVSLSGYDTSQTPDKNWVVGLAQYSDFSKTGEFSSSHEKLNKLQKNIKWGLQGNFLDIPTDCPQRDERLGWTGDAQVFAPTSLFIADVHSFWASWLQSMREEQGPAGQIPFVVPNILSPTGVSSGWGDAAVIIPWELYYRTGDKKVLLDNYEMMKKWVSFHQEQSENHLSSMNSFSDWLQPYAKMKNGKQNRKGDTPMFLISTAFNAHVTHLTMQAAGVLGKTEDQKKYGELFQNIKNAFYSNYFNKDGSIKNDDGTQTGYLLSLGFELIPEDKISLVATHLLEKIKEADNHLRTGFLGTPLLPKVLDDLGEVDLMYQILFKESYPSWFYSINQGATTMWERWNSYSKKDGFGDAGMNSFNHYAYGAIGQWMYERIAGIAPMAPGYKEIRIAPIPGGPLTSANASYESPYGTIANSWKKTGEAFEMQSIIPPNTTAIIKIPLNDVDDKISINGKKLKGLKDITLIEKSNSTITLKANPGTYTFKTSKGL